MTEVKNLRVAIVCDWLLGIGGAERVALELHKMFPDAPIYTSYCSPDLRKKLDGQVVTGYLQRWPFSKLRKFLPMLRIWWFTHLDFSEYDLVISSSGNGEAKGVRVPKESTHIYYCLSPTHYYWRHYNQYLSNPGFGIFNPLARFGLRILVGPLRKWDLRAAQRPDYLIGISSHIQADIKKYYGRDSIVVHPPVDVDRFVNSPKTQRHGFITVGRQTPYKHTDLIVEACSKLDLLLTVVGQGPEHKKLMRLASPAIKFAEASDQEVAKHLTSAEAFLFAAYEDFGIVPVEAMAAGTPVIAYKAGGALDYVAPGKTGEFFEKQTVKSLSDALIKFNPDKYNNSDIAKHAASFSPDRFHKEIRQFIESVIS